MQNEITPTEELLNTHIKNLETFEDCVKAHNTMSFIIALLM